MSRILDVYNESNFEFTPNFLVITFPFDEGFIGRGQETTNKRPEKHFDLDLKIIDIMKSNPCITSERILNELSVGITKIKKAIAQLKIDGKIERKG